MASRLEEFVAEELGKLLPFLTMALSMIALLVWGPSAMLATFAVGLLLFTPLFVIWGEDIAAMLFDEQESETPDALDELKRRYAEGEIGEAEFEQRLERLVEMDVVSNEAFTVHSDAEGGRSDANRSRPSTDVPSEESLVEEER